jgi:uncharacterized membrane-anchored protein
MKSVKLLVLFGFLAVVVGGSSVSTSFADQSPFAFRPDPVNWIQGPAKANLGNYAEITIPEGYRFASADDAAALLKIMKNPVPKTLAGILTPAGGKFMVVFEFTDIGYVQDDGKEQLNPVAILKTLRQKVERENEQAVKNGTPAITFVDWASAPEYNRNTHTLEWSIEASSGSGKAVNHVMRVFGREGVLDGIAVQPDRAGDDAIPLRGLMAGVAFKPGHAYADYRKGDTISTQGLNELITADGSTEKAGVSLALILSLAGGAVVVLGGVGFWLWRKKARGQQAQPEEKRKVSTVPAAVAAAHQNGSAQLLPRSVVSTRERVVSVNGNGNGNGKTNGHAHKPKRKRIFNYQKYYSDLLFQVSDRAYETDVLKPHVNGRRAISAPAADKSSDSSALSSNVGLIESQKHLIEEQQRLIREQTKLIEEKTKLIQEKNQVLEKQAELFGNQVF